MRSDQVETEPVASPRPFRIVNQMRSARTAIAAAKAPANSHSVRWRIDWLSISTLISTGVPSRRSARCCSQARMLPRGSLIRLVGLEIAGVVLDDPAGQVQPERDDLRSRSSRRSLKRARPQRRGAHLLLEGVMPVLRRERVA